MRIVKVLFFLLLYFLFIARIFAEKWLPYYLFDFSEGIYLPSKGKLGFATVLLNDIGFILKPIDEHTGIFYYQLKYEGPGLKRQEGEKFEQRMIGHSLILQHSYKYKFFVFKTKFNYGYDFLRSGTNELWGLGLYDNERIGLLEEVEYKFLEDFKLKGQIGYNFIKFPNYTSLIEEYISGAEETTAGKQDNHMFLANLKLNYKINNFGILSIIQNYINQQVLDETATYSNEKQKDFSLEINYYIETLKLTKFLSFSPYTAFKYKDSNQAFLYLISYDITTSTPQVVKDYYDYTKIIFSFPFNFYLTETKILSFIPEFEITSYLFRQPRDENNNFIENEKQKNFLALYSLIYTSQSFDKHRKVSLFYTYQQQSSNMKFEKYYPYNYSAHYFGIKFSYSY